MKRIGLLLLIFGGFILPLSAAHIRGGELYYKYTGPGIGANSSTYLVTLKLYIDCGQNDPGQLDTEVALTIFTKPNNNQWGPVVTARMTKEMFIQYDPLSNPCINNPPLDVCYRLRYYEASITLYNDPNGYTIAFQRCCRIEGIKNLRAPSNDFGATYLCEIPGTSILPDAIQNSSPVISTNDAVAVCARTNFEFDFSAKDPENDSLVYELCEAFAGGGPNNGLTCLNCPTPNPGAPPPYITLPYSLGYSGSVPMGNSVKLNRKTGLLDGIAPIGVGQYVVTVCISEYRRGVLINVHRKDIHIKVSDCIPLRAVLDPDYSYCDNFLVTFRNKQINPTGSVYTWNFGDGTAAETSTVPDGTLEHQYTDTGTYFVKMRVVLAGQCIDSAVTRAKVYPGFFPGFSFDGACLFTPFIFTDTTKSRYGRPSYWRWDFGDENSSADTSHASSPSWLYSSLGLKNIQLIVATDKGCIDTVPGQVAVTEEPDILIPFTDTLICSIDSLQLRAIGDGTFIWSPAYNIFNENTASPTVYPKNTTTYSVTMTEDRCVVTKNIRVRVVDFVTLNAGSDTTICRTDTIQLAPSGDGLKFTWVATPAAYFDDPAKKNPFTSPLSPVTRYHVQAKIGSCFADDDLSVRTVPYPVVNAGADATICYDDTVNITGYTNGSSFRWDPAVSLVNPASLSPLFYPHRTRTYTLLGFDTLGCPKPGVDRIVITVRPQIIAFAGNDTAVVKGQPLQLNGSGSDFYSWSPETGLNRTSVNNPVAVLQRNTSYIMRTFTEEGCFSIDTVNVQVFQTMPQIFVPNAFVPTGRNNELRPKAVGMRSLDYFIVYNRWGQIVFQTAQLGKGWDGRLKGVIQNSDTYVWVVSGTDYTGLKIKKKGTAVLIR